MKPFYVMESQKPPLRMINANHHTSEMSLYFYYQLACTLLQSIETVKYSFFLFVSEVMIVFMVIN